MGGFECVGDGSLTLQTIEHGERVQLNIGAERWPVDRREAQAFMAMSN